MSKKKLDAIMTNEAKVELAGIQDSLIDTKPHTGFEEAIEKFEISLEADQAEQTITDRQIELKKRFIDDFEMVEKSKNFNMRQHFGTYYGLFSSYVVALLLSLFLMVIYSGDVALSLMVVCLIALPVIINVFYLRKFYRVNNAIEYQNFIFTNALRSDNEFYFIFSEEGAAIYCDPRLESLMTSGNSADLHEIDLLLLSYGAENSKIKAVKEMVFGTRSDNSKKDIEFDLEFKTKGKFSVLAKKLAQPNNYTVVKMVALKS